MHISTEVSAGKARMTLSGRFDFHTHRDFRSTYETLLERGDVHEVVVSFQDVEYLDSSALGMLLLLREKADVVGKGVGLTDMHGMVAQVIEIANFHNLFSIYANEPR